MDDAEVLDAGGILPGVPRSERPSLDRVTARAYRHPALDGDRVVIRLTAASLGEADDLGLSLLGFAPAGVARDVGTAVRRALGFPAWAMVHAPEFARVALAVVPDMDRFARLARSKPSNALAGYTELAAGLDGTAAVLLPTFWEEAGRAFLAAGNTKTAATCFLRARDAERVHALAIDEARLGDVFLEYAFAGALPAKAMSEYARDLAARLPADAAFERYRSVASQRIAGGLPPHAGFPAELARLARAADRAAPIDTLRELLRLPAVGRAPLSFWTAYRSELTTLMAEPASARALLAIEPAPDGVPYDEVHDTWTGLLDEVGATRHLQEPEYGAQWLTRILARRGTRWTSDRSAPLIALAERIAPALAAAGVAVHYPETRHHNASDLDVLDVLLAAGAPVDVSAFVGGLDRRGDPIPLVAWLADMRPGRRDLAALATDPRTAAAFRAGAAALLRPDRLPWPFRASRTRLTIVASIGPVLAAVTAAFDAVLNAVATGPTLAGLSDLTEIVAGLANQAGAAVLGTDPGRLDRVDVAAALAGTLRTEDFEGDERGRLALRTVTAEQARRMLAGVPDLPPGRRHETEPLTAQAVRVALPAITDAALARAVARVVIRAGLAARHLAEVRSAWSALPAAPVRRMPEPDARPAQEVVAGLVPYDGIAHWDSPHPNTSVDQIRAFGAELAAPGTESGWSGSDWPVLLGIEPALLVRAVSPAYPDVQRVAARRLAAALAGAGLTGRDGTVRRLLLQGPAGDVPEEGTSVPVGTSRVYSVCASVLGPAGPYAPRRLRAVQVDPSGRFPAPAHLQRTDRWPEADLDAARVERFLELLAARGVPAWPAAAVSALAAETGASAAVAALILAGLPGIDQRDPVPDAATRKALGLSGRAAVLANERLRALDHGRRVELLDAVVPADPEDLWTTGPDVARIAAAWRRLCGEDDTGPDDESLAAIRRIIAGARGPFSGGPSAGDAVLVALFGPESAPLDLDGDDDLPALVASLIHLAYTLPVGDANRAALPGRYDRILAALRHRGAGVTVGYMAGPPPELPSLATVHPMPGDMYEVRIEMAKLTGPDDPALRVFGDWAGALALRMLYSHALRGTIDAIRAEPADRPGYPHDPQRSVPELVAEIATEYRLSPPAAAYYLQILALPDPTDRHVRRWTGADPRAERAELVGRGLLVEGKRARAGRSAFLPGGWTVLKAPRLPVETWKLALYGWDAADRPNQRWFGVADSVPTLFARAAQRLRAGHGPTVESA